MDEQNKWHPPKQGKKILLFHLLALEYKIDMPLESFNFRHVPLNIRHTYINTYLIIHYIKYKKIYSKMVNKKLLVFKVLILERNVSLNTLPQCKRSLVLVHDLDQRTVHRSYYNFQFYCLAFSCGEKLDCSLWICQSNLLEKLQMAILSNAVFHWPLY